MSLNLQGFEGKVLAYDPYPSEKAKELGVSYVPLEQLMREADVVSLHVPLLPSTRHIIGPANLKLLKPTALVINVSRGGLIDTSAAIASLTDGNLGGLAVDVYEGEGGCGVGKEGRGFRWFGLTVCAPRHQECAPHPSFPF